MKQLKSPNYNKIFGKLTPKINDFTKTICEVDTLLSKKFRFVGERYENGEQTLFYRRGSITISVSIEETD